MTERPRNEGVSSIDLALLFSMPAVIAVLLVVIAYLGAQTPH